MSETPSESNAAIADTLRHQYKLNIDKEILRDDILGGLSDGRDWILRKYGWLSKPNIDIGNHKGYLNNLSGFTEVDGEKVIALHVNDLRMFEGAKKTTTFPVYSGIDVPIQPIVTVRQWFEAFAVEETGHWLQDQGVKGLVGLPPQGQRISSRYDTGIKYSILPHEFQMLEEKGQYFMEKYKYNPFQELEDFLRSKRT